MWYKLKNVKFIGLLNFDIIVYGICFVVGKRYVVIVRMDEKYDI